MEKKDSLDSIINEVCDLVQTLTVTEIVYDFRAFKRRSDSLVSSVQSLAALVRIAELIKHKKYS